MHYKIGRVDLVTRIALNVYLCLTRLVHFVVLATLFKIKLAEHVIQTAWHATLFLTQIVLLV